jgi:hypothetical protein
MEPPAVLCRRPSELEQRHVKPDNEVGIAPEERADQVEVVPVDDHDGWLRRSAIPRTELLPRGGRPVDAVVPGVELDVRA